METNSKIGGESDSDLASIALPGQKLVTSKNPRMLTPSEIALLQQDLQAVLKVVGLDSWNWDEEVEEESLEHYQSGPVSDASKS